MDDMFLLEPTIDEFVRILHDRLPVVHELIASVCGFRRMIRLGVESTAHDRRIYLNSEKEILPALTCGGKEMLFIRYELISQMKKLGFIRLDTLEVASKLAEAFGLAADQNEEVVTRLKLKRL